MPDPDGFTVKLDGNMFSRMAILRVMHDLRECGIVEVTVHGSSYVVTVKRTVLPDEQLHKLILDSAVDNQLRVELEASSAKIRNLLIAKAIESSVSVEDVEAVVQGECHGKL